MVLFLCYNYFIFNMATKERPEVEQGVSNGQDVPDILNSFKEYYNKDAGCAMSPVSRNDPCYKMDHKRRGHAIIFNNENFDYPGLEPRAGTTVDAENLCKTLMSIGFDVAVYNEHKSYEIENVVTKVSEQDHTDCDCFLLAVLSHGKQGIIYAKDSAYKPDSLWSKFTADVCPSLAGKPKLFIIQTCQGDRFDGGVTMRTTEVDSGAATFSLPVHADILVAYSTVPGFYSWRNPSCGSWFIQALCAELQENAYNYDFLTLLTFVNQRVALDFESFVPNNYREHKQKQVPCITFMLTRLLRFSKNENSVL